ncbi:MAG: 23S rRNA (uracil(1939)-C(5))-methyltransferase RlmD [Candidatus Melainabacteria bacterium]|nr:23S rRNA (uracil(1939)-C(5))-methyltransferase RlmD [Candidatus Melainabacteria bacterium]
MYHKYNNIEVIIIAKATLKSIPVSQDEIVELQIESMAYDNAAVARYKDFVIFVDRGAPGDVVKAQITTLRPNYARAKIVEIKTSSSEYRIDAPCKLYKVCGGCQWQHLPYEKQLEQKNLLMKQFTSRLQLKNWVVKPIVGVKDVIASEAKQSRSHRQEQIEIASSQQVAPRNDIWNYRNKVQYPVRTVESTGRLKAGYYEWHSNDLVNIKYCPIGNELFDSVVETVRELAPKYNIVAYDGKTKKGWLRHICVRQALSTGATLLTLVVINEKLSRSQDFVNELINKHPALVGVCFNVNTGTTNVIYGPKTHVIQGKGYIFENIKGINYKISATSFFQVNSIQAEKMLDIVDQLAPLSGDEKILDAYSGVGLITLYLAKKVKKVIGIEEIKQSIEDAEFTAKKNNLSNACFINGKVENKIEDILENEKPDVVILDPPRGGCSKTVLQNLLDSKCNKIIYVSCNPATLVRDLEILCENMNPFEIQSIQPIDMFPHTYHIESVVSLERNKK